MNARQKAVGHRRARAQLEHWAPPSPSQGHEQGNAAVRFKVTRYYLQVVTPRDELIELPLSQAKLAEQLGAANGRQNRKILGTARPHRHVPRDASSALSECLSMDYSRAQIRSDAADRYWRACRSSKRSPAPGRFQPLLASPESQCLPYRLAMPLGIQNGSSCTNAPRIGADRSDRKLEHTAR